VREAEAAARREQRQLKLQQQREAERSKHNPALLYGLPVVLVMMLNNSAGSSSGSGGSSSGFGFGGFLFVLGGLLYVGKVLLDQQKAERKAAREARRAAGGEQPASPAMLERSATQKSRVGRSGTIKAANPFGAAPDLSLLDDELDGAGAGGDLDSVNVALNQGVAVARRERSPSSQATKKKSMTFGKSASRTASRR
jgi:hypothetical protein